MWRWKIETGNLPFQVTEWNWVKLQNSWQGNVISYSEVRKLETFIGRCKIPIWSVKRSQKLGILHKGIEVKS